MASALQGSWARIPYKPKFFSDCLSCVYNSGDPSCLHSDLSLLFYLDKWRLFYVPHFYFSTFTSANNKSVRDLHSRKREGLRPFSKLLFGQREIGVTDQSARVFFRSLHVVLVKRYTFRLLRELQAWHKMTIKDLQHCLRVTDRVCRLQEVPRCEKLSVCLSYFLILKQILETLHIWGFFK